MTRPTVGFLRKKSGLPKIDRYMTEVIGIFETALFAGIFIFLSIYAATPYQVASNIFVAAATWIGLKTLGYKADDRSKKDRKENKESDQDQTATRYVFLIGSLLNIALGIFIGFVVSKFWT